MKPNPEEPPARPLWQRVLILLALLLVYLLLFLCPPPWPLSEDGAPLPPPIRR